jgi:ABC-type amino acid transport substrate-binding protein
MPFMNILCRIRSMLRATVLAAAFLAPQAHPAHADTLATIRATGQLNICIWPDYYGITFRDPRSGVLAGIDIELARAFAGDLGVKPVFVETSFVRFTTDLADHKCDIAMFGVGITPERAAKVSFTAPTLRSDVVAVIMKDRSPIARWSDIDVPSRVVAVQAGTFMEPLMRATLKRAELLVITAPDSREDALLSGRADVFISDYPYTRRVLDFLSWAAIIAPTEPVRPVNYAYAVASDDTAWLARADAFVAAIKQDGRLLAAAARHKLEAIALLK